MTFLQRNHNFKDIAGQRMDMLEVVSYSQSKKGKAFWICKCDCGKEKEISGEKLRGGQYSCGCTKRGKRSHGMSKTKTYSIWEGMLSRCTNPLVQKFDNYGGRGISVCSSWHKFENFFADMGPCPSGYSIERNDNEGDYKPGNCKWIPLKDQGSNKRNNRVIEYLGRKLTTAQWAREKHIPYSRLISRLNSGWSAERILESAKWQRS